MYFFLYYLLKNFLIEKVIYKLILKKNLIDIDL